MAGRRTSSSSRRAVSGVLLAPGAGGSSDSPAIADLAEAIAGAGVEVERMDFPYRLAGRRRPDTGAVLEAEVRARAVDFAGRLGVEPRQLVLGGRSMGGRICSQVVAAGHPAAGLLLISYPLHPPGRPERLRTAHFPDLDVPCLFVSGTKDAFGTREELEAATAAIHGPVTHDWLEGGDHGLRRLGPQASEAAVTWLRSTFSLVGR